MLRKALERIDQPATVVAVLAVLVSVLGGLALKHSRDAALLALEKYKREVPQEVLRMQGGRLLCNSSPSRPKLSVTYAIVH